MEQHHSCTVCKRSDIRLYRYYGAQLRTAEIYCRAHAPEGHIQKQLLVPLIEDPDTPIAVWGHHTAPALAIARWEALPEGEKDDSP